jgi:hypothetical protein
MTPRVRDGCAQARAALAQWSSERTRLIDWTEQNKDVRAVQRQLSGGYFEARRVASSRQKLYAQSLLAIDDRLRLLRAVCADLDDATLTAIDSAVDDWNAIAPQQSVNCLRPLAGFHIEGSPAA